MNMKQTSDKKFGKTSRCACMFIMIAMLGITPLCFAETETPANKTSMEDIKQQTQELLQSLKTYTAAQRDEAVQKTKEALFNLDTRIDELEKNIDCHWDKMDDAAREKATVTLRALRKQRIQAAEWFGSMKNSSADAWERMKKGFSDAYKDLDDTWQKAEKEFGTGK